MAYDCFFITDDLSVHLIERYKKVLEKIPNAQLVKSNDLSDINSLYTEIKKRVNTEYYWVIDNEINVQDFDWNFKPTEWDNELPHIWSTVLEMNMVMTSVLN